ncbi:MAG: hypothetical protein Harvfovirus51_3 [Harvfovirus sp.]|uniref:Uncharacterized protein n=1 Tax=Harvfovirus sp. TaxID=2487768 RepID=A0A3G5A5Z9_9VIRU|nr:MAG: hypothetical protein Harvfovirus51_3 [Harvfovirus sp.]
MNPIYYIVFFILAIVALILTAYALQYGENSKPGIWTLYGLNIVMFLIALWFIFKKNTYGSAIALFLQFVLYVIVFFMTNNAGNLVNNGVGTFTAANVFVVLQLLSSFFLLNHFHDLEA